MPSRCLSALAADLSHVVSVFRDALATFAADFSHMLTVTGDGQTAFASDFLSGFRVHRCSATQSFARLAALSFDRAPFGGHRRCISFLTLSLGVFMSFLFALFVSLAVIRANLLVKFGHRTSLGFHKLEFDFLCPLQGAIGIPGRF